MIVSGWDSFISKLFLIKKSLSCIINSNYYRMCVFEDTCFLSGEHDGSLQCHSSNKLSKVLKGEWAPHIFV